jgi:N-acetylglucosamine malate deacetylase 1
MKILAIGAHPDDIEIFMYGTIAACFDRGDEVITCIATDGSAGDVRSSKDLSKLRKLETIKGLNQFGKPLFLNFKDGKLLQSDNSQKILDDLISKTKPDFVITHDPFDYHPDHRELSRLVCNAAGFSYPVFFCDTLMGINFLPEYYVDITKFFDLKKNAIMCHESQFPEKFLEVSQIMNGYRAAQCNLPKKNYVEVFRAYKRFPFVDLRNLLPSAPELRSFYQNSKTSMI